jgi:hypothetical protein
MHRYTRKSVRQTFWTGVVLLAASIAWLLGSAWIAVEFKFDAKSNLYAGIMLLPFFMLLMAAIGFLATWLMFCFYRAMGLAELYDDPQP